MNRLVPIILAVALFMENMDSTVIATSLPAIAVDLGTSPIALKLALTAYMVSLAIFIPISGFMADKIGAKRLFRCAIGVFLLGSIACALANSLGFFVGARFLQGMGGAMMTPVARLVLVRSTPRDQLITAMAWLTIPALVGPMAGPPVGGFVTTYFSWHWIFIINVPIGILGIYLSGRYLPEIESAEPERRLDWPGFALVAIAASGVVFGLSVISLPALPPVFGIGALVAGSIALALYILYARHAPAPILDLRLFANPTFRAAIIGGSLFRIGIGAVPFLLPLLLQTVFDLDPFQSGLVTFISAAGAFSMKFLAPKILRAFGFRTVMIMTTIVSTLLVGVNGLYQPGLSFLVIMPLLYASGFLRSLFFTSANVLIFADTRTEETGNATAISATMQQISLALGVALGGTVLEVAALNGSGEITQISFSWAFSAMALITAMAILPFLRLPKSAGSILSGHGNAHAPATGTQRDKTC